MERGSDKHGPRLDETMKHETEPLVRAGHEGHVEEWREAEPPGEDEPEAGRSPEGALAGGTPPGMTPEDVAGRAELATYLERTPFPAVREQLIGTAIDREAPERVVGRLRELPSGQVFDNVAEVWRALGGGSETHRF